MTAALFAAAAVWCAIPMSTAPRVRRLLAARARPTRGDPAIVTAVLVPVASVALLGMPMGLLIGLALVPVVCRAVGRLESASMRRRTAQLTAALPAALDLMVAALEVGRPPVTAFALAAEATVDPLGAELAVVAGRLAIAADPETVWRSVADDPTLAPIGRAFRRADSSGMPVAEIVSGVADELRRERGARLREHSRKVAVRTAAPLGACFLPAFFLVGIVPTVMASFSTLSW